MNNRPDDDENRIGGPNWLSELARVYGPWHLTVTLLQGIVWTCLVVWTESGSHQHWSHALRAVGILVWPALTAFSITAVAILVVVQKGGRIVLTFIDERRQRIRKAHQEGREEGREKGRVEGRVEGRAEGWEKGRADTLRELSLDPRIAAILRERGIEPTDRRNGDDTADES